MKGLIAIQLSQFAMRMGVFATAASIEEFANKIQKDLFCRTISVKEAAVSLNVCTHTIYRMIQAGAICASCVNPASKRKTYKIPLAEILRLKHNDDDPTQAYLEA